MKILTFLIIFTTIFQATLAQPPPPPPQENLIFIVKLTLSVGIIMVLLVTAFLILGCFIIYMNRYYENPNGASIHRRATSTGLEEAVIETFPVFRYAEVKDKRIGEGGLECAVCLNEFEDDEMLRLLPKCDHVFHPQCIDAWLLAHATCPLCRAKLSPTRTQVEEEAPASVPPVVEDNEANAHQGEETIQEQPITNDVSIRIECEEEQQNARPDMENTNLRNNGGSNRVGEPSSIKGRKMFTFRKFRCHSTGHSLVFTRENLERFTLRLPEGVRKEVLNRALMNRNKNCARGFQCEGGSRGGSRTGLRFLDRIVGSDRWGFLTRPSL